MLKKLKMIDFGILLPIIVLQIISLIAISSATRVNLGSSIRTMKLQAVWIVFSLVIFMLVSISKKIKINNISGGFAYFLYIANLILLLSVGTTINGSARWLDIAGFRFQPSEFAKIIMIIFIAYFIDKHKEDLMEPKTILKILFLVAVPLMLILSQPDLSTSIVFIAIFLGQIFVAGIDSKYIKKALIIGVPLVIILTWYVQQDYQVLLTKNQRIRVLAMFNPDDYSQDYNYQTNKSLQAVGAGRVIGKGLYKGTLNQLSYLPEPETDFIFSVFAEEFGFIGSFLIILMYFIIIARCVMIAKDSNNYRNYLIVSGVITMLFAQVFINIGVATGIVPNTGMPLPFVSYGGSSMLTCIVAVAIVMNIKIQRMDLF